VHRIWFDIYIHVHVFLHQALVSDFSVRVGAMQKCINMIILLYIVVNRLEVWAHWSETCNWFTPGVFDAFPGLCVDIERHVASSWNSRTTTIKRTLDLVDSDQRVDDTILDEPSITPIIINAVLAIGTIHVLITDGQTSTAEGSTKNVEFWPLLAQQEHGWN
jgi:hypothetical protein